MDAAGNGQSLIIDTMGFLRGAARRADESVGRAHEGVSAAYGHAVRYRQVPGHARGVDTVPAPSRLEGLARRRCDRWISNAAESVPTSCPPVGAVASEPRAGDHARMTDEISAALETMVSRFATMVRSIGARHRLSDTDLDEVLQEVRVRLWKSCTTSEQIRALGASYVYRTATSAALDMLRRRRAHGGERGESMESVANELPALSAAPDDALEARELEQRVMAAIDSIPASRRPAVRMYLNGYDRAEIAELLGWTEAKTRNLLYRGLGDLRARLADAGIREPI